PPRTFPESKPVSGVFHGHQPQFAVLLRDKMRAAGPQCAPRARRGSTLRTLDEVTAWTSLSEFGSTQRSPSMKAVGNRTSLPIDHADSLIHLDLPEPSPLARDLLIEVKAVSVNPVDTKVRKREEPKDGRAKILGYDAAGVVK